MMLKLKSNAKKNLTHQKKRALCRFPKLTTIVMTKKMNPHTTYIKDKVATIILLTQKTSISAQALATIVLCLRHTVNLDQ